MAAMETPCKRKRLMPQRFGDYFNEWDFCSDCWNAVYITKLRRCRMCHQMMCHGCSSKDLLCGGCFKMLALKRVFKNHNTFGAIERTILELDGSCLWESMAENYRY